MSELLQVIDSWKGFSPITEVPKPADYELRFEETKNLLSNARGLPAHRAEYLLREALTTSDFPLLFGDVLDRQVLAAYRAVDPVWRSFTRASTVRRIFPQIGGYRFAITGGDQVLAEVPQKTEYPESTRTEAQYPVFVRKYGRIFNISWEAIINDDLGALRDTPTRFAMAATRTEHRLVTGLYSHDVAANHVGHLYSAAVPGEVNVVAALLTIPNLEAALQAMGSFLDANGEPIMNRAKYLVVPPGLEMTARAILTSATKMWLSDAAVAASATTALPYPITNVVSQMGLTLIVDPYLPVLDPTPANGLTAWYLFADPGDIAAIEADQLQGHERPEICMKDSNKVAVGGGSISPMEGDFESDNIVYRVRDVFGANRLDWRATYMGGHTA